MSDGINFRWRGPRSLSPAELYDLAFNAWTASPTFLGLVPRTSGVTSWDPAYYEQLGPLAQEAHRRYGNRLATNGVDDDGDGQVDEIDDNDGIESWWGICHAWAAAALMEPEPQQPVSHGQQLFSTGDLKALLAASYADGPAIALGGRCHERDVKRDTRGRILAGDCRDMGPQGFHVALTNLLGLYRRAFAEDRASGGRPLSRPIRGFEITSLRDQLTAAEALAVLERTDSVLPVNPLAASFAEVRMTVRYITEMEPSEEPSLPEIDARTSSDRYHYILELDRNGNIIGGEWCSDSQSAPDMLWLPTGPGTRLGSLSYDNVQRLLNRSQLRAARTMTFQSPAGVANPEDGPAGMSSVIDVLSTGAIRSLRVRLTVPRRPLANLIVELRHNGQRRILHNRAGRSTDGLDSEYQVSEFNGSNINGAWELFVSDNARRDTGEIVQWEMTAEVL